MKLCKAEFPSLCPRTLVCTLALLACPAHANPPNVDYLIQCQGCHLADGSASRDVPALKDRIGRFIEVPGGRAYLVQVPGSAQAAIDDARLAAVLNWMIERFGPERVARDFTRFGTEEVRRYRREPLVDVEPLRSELLAAVAALEAKRAAD